MDNDCNAVAYLILDGQIERAKQMYDELGDELYASPISFAILYEDGNVVKKDDHEAYVYYLIARSNKDVRRYLDMSYGEKVTADADFSLDGVEEKVEYWYYKLLCDAGAGADFKTVALASRWYLLDDERWNDKDPAEKYANASTRLTDSEFWSQKRKNLALFQLEEANKLLDGELSKEKIKNVIHYLGGYFAYLSCGNHDNIYYFEMANTGDEYDSQWEKRYLYDTEKALSYVKNTQMTETRSQIGPFTFMNSTRRNNHEKRYWDEGS